MSIIGILWLGLSSVGRYASVKEVGGMQVFCDLPCLSASVLLSRPGEVSLAEICSAVTCVARGTSCSIKAHTGYSTALTLSNSDLSQPDNHYGHLSAV